MNIFPQLPELTQKVITVDPASNVFIHNGTMGDVIASFPSIEQWCKLSGKKARLYLINGQKADYYPGATHPTRDDKDGNVQVMLNSKMIEMLVPLIKAQPFIEDAGEYMEGMPIRCDLNRIREREINLPNGCISRWYFYVYPDFACDLSRKWLSVPQTKKNLAKGKIIISRTERYVNQNIHYGFLKKYESECVFIGTELEHGIFNLRFGLNIPHLKVNNFLELAQAIQQSLFHISNQTMAFQISQGLKHPRIVELCSYAQNVIPVGEDAYDFFAQEALECYTHILYQKHKKGQQVNDTLFKKVLNENQIKTGC